MTSRTKKDVMSLIRKVFGDIAVVEAKENLRLQPLPCDAEGAEANSPDNCLLVHTAQRMYGAKAAVFWKTKAYVDFVDEDGKRRVHRYVNPGVTIKQIRDFDNGKPFIEGRGLILRRPAKTQTRKFSSKANKEWYDTQKGKKQRKVDNIRRQLGNAEQRLEDALAAKRELASKRPDAKKTKLIEAKVAGERRRIADKRRDLVRIQASPIKNPAPRSYVFDLTSRNGAVGNYQFVRQ